MCVDSVAVWQCVSGQQAAQCGDTERAVGREVGPWELPSTTLPLSPHHCSGNSLSHQPHYYYSHRTTAKYSLTPILEKALCSPSWLGLKQNHTESPFAWCNCSADQLYRCGLKQGSWNQDKWRLFLLKTTYLSMYQFHIAQNWQKLDQIAIERSASKSWSWFSSISASAHQ